MPSPANASTASAVGAMWQLLLLLLSGAGALTGVAGFCSQHRYALAADAATNNVMQFTKEVVSKEYALAAEYKSLHCCAKRYQSIEW